MKFDLTLATILVFLVPGTVVILGYPGSFPAELETLRSFARTPNASELAMALCASFFAGVAIDSIRLVTVQPLIGWLAKITGAKPLPSDYVSSLTPEALPVFEMLVERSFEYYRLNCNVTTALLALVASHILWCAYNHLLVGALFTALLWTAISLKSRKDNDALVRQFVKRTAIEEET